MNALNAADTYLKMIKAAIDGSVLGRLTGELPTIGNYTVNLSQSGLQCENIIKMGVVVVVGVWGWWCCSKKVNCIYISTHTHTHP